MITQYELIQNLKREIAVYHTIYLSTGSEFYRNKVINAQIELKELEK